MDTTYFYTQRMFRYEHESAAMIARMVGKARPITPITKGLDEVQASAVRNACNNRVSLLCGSAGSGKTTTTRCVVQSFSAAGLRGIGMAPAAKAARRMDEVFRGNGDTIEYPPDCGTMHKGTKTGFGGKGDEYEVPYDYILVDETGNLGTPMFHRLLTCINPKRTRVVFTGDPNQLASIEPGNVMADMLACGSIPAVRLEKVYRQGENSGIVQNANRILRGESLLSHDPHTGKRFQDFFFIESPTPEATRDRIMEYLGKMKETFPKFDVNRDVQILSPGKKGACGTIELNKAVRELVNPTPLEPGSFFGKQDRVINRKNTEALGIVNGEVGHILEAKAGSARVNFGEGSGIDGSGKVLMDGESFGNLNLAYAFTIHSSQGSEFPVCFMPIHRSHMMLLDRGLLYTGVTRARELCFVIGEASALERCLYNDSVQRRYTNLRHLIPLYLERLRKVA